jgi:hypothetical protein
MATTINSTDLDFNTIKNNLKTFLANKDEFRDYNFEASGLSNILDVLAYNTHYNGLIANFALNESFLSTAQLRPSVVSHSVGLGYIPDSKTSSSAVVQMTLNFGAVSDVQNPISIPAGHKFTASVDGITYNYQTREQITAVDDGKGFYQFKTLDDNSNVTITEGNSKTKTFIVGPYAENVSYIIPDSNLDIGTVTVTLYTSPTTTTGTTYRNILDLEEITSQSRIFILRETPNGFYELSFGDGTTLGVVPDTGNKIVVEYISTNGSTANGCTTFVSGATSVLVGGSSVSKTIVTTTVSGSVGGSPKETIESIRKNAPFQYASQNRMVTSEDYKSLALRKFSQVISDINTWGGEDNLVPTYGAVFYSIKFKDNLSPTVIANTKNSLKDLGSNLAVSSFTSEFLDPANTYVELDVFYRFNNKLTTKSENTVKTEVIAVIQNYFTTISDKFNSAFRRSNLLTLIDGVGNSVLSSRTDVRVAKRFSINLGISKTYTDRVPVTLASPDDKNYIIDSSTFTFNNQICKIKNKLNSTILQIISVVDNTVLVSNTGSYKEDGTISVEAFNPQSITGGLNFIKISGVPSNQSVLPLVRNELLQYDQQSSLVRVVPTTATT